MVKLFRRIKSGAPSGAKGPTGLQGFQGPLGYQGGALPGLPGNQGDPGPTGDNRFDEDLANVSATGASNGDIVRYQTSSEEWKISIQSITKNQIDFGGIPDFVDQSTAQSNLDPYSLYTITGDNSIRLVPESLPEWAQKGSTIAGNASNDYSGQYIDINEAGDRIVIGSPRSGGGTNFFGQIRVFEFSGGSWSQLGSNINGTTSNDRLGSGVSINSTGDIIAGWGFQDGVRTYQYSGGSWNQIGDPTDFSFDGYISLNSAGTRIAIGNGSTTVQIYDYNSGADEWQQVGSNITGSSRFGSTVALNSSGDRVAIGAPDASSFRGQIYVYEYSVSWTQVNSTITFSAPNSRFSVGLSINAAGDRVAGNSRVAAFLGNFSYTRVYEDSGGSWSQLGSDIVSDSAFDQSSSAISTYQWYGIRLNADGDRILIGYPTDDDASSNAGKIRLYEYSGGSWSTLVEFDGSNSNDDNLGVSVAINGDGTVIAGGAHLADDNGTDSGHVKVFSFE